MTLWRRAVCGSVTGVVLVCAFGCGGGGPASPVPSARKVLELARSTTFSASAEREVPAPPPVRSLNPGFAISLFQATDAASPTPSTDGGVLARLAIQGVSAPHGVPDGEYFLWSGGSADARHAALVSSDGATTKTLEVFSRPSGPTLRWEIQSAPLASGEHLGSGCASGTLWLQVCFGAGQLNGRGEPQRCVRVPAS